MEVVGGMRAKPSWGSRLVGMDGLRGAAAVSVLLAHVRVHMAAGVDLGLITSAVGALGRGLTLFFTLSGFLLYRPFATAILSNQPMPNLFEYARNRAVRIFPAYLFILFLASLVLGVAYTTSIPFGQEVEGSGETVGFLTEPTKLVANVFMVQSFFPGTIKTGLGVSWSLSVELVFYAVMPLLAYAAWRLASGGHLRRTLAAFLPAALTCAIGCVGVAVVALSVHARTDAELFYVQWGGNWSAVLMRSFLVQAPLFVFGMMAAVVVSLFRLGLIRTAFARAARWSSIVLAVLAVVLSRVIGMQELAWAFAFGNLVIFVALPSKGGNPGYAAKLLELLPLRFMGLISYGLYLWHVPVIWLVGRFGIQAQESVAGYAVNAVLVLTFSAGLASLTFLLVERPAMRLKKRSRSQPSENAVVR